MLREMLEMIIPKRKAQGQPSDALLDVCLAKWKEAMQEYQIALQNYHHAEPEYIDIAISDIRIAEEKMSNELRKMKLLLR